MLYIILYIYVHSVTHTQFNILISDMKREANVKLLFITHTITDTYTRSRSDELGKTNQVETNESTSKIKQFR